MHVIHEVLDIIDALLKCQITQVLSRERRKRVAQSEETMLKDDSSSILRLGEETVEGDVGQVSYVFWLTGGIYYNLSLISSTQK